MQNWGLKELKNVNLPYNFSINLKRSESERSNEAGGFFQEGIGGRGSGRHDWGINRYCLDETSVQGVIIDSGIRDVAQICDLGFPIWTKAVFSQGTTKSKGGWVNAPTVCGGVTVGPGELIMADDDGVVVVKKG